MPLIDPQELLRPLEQHETTDEAASQDNQAPESPYALIDADKWYKEVSSPEGRLAAAAHSLGRGALGLYQDVIGIPKTSMDIMAAAPEAAIDLATKLGYPEEAARRLKKETMADEVAALVRPVSREIEEEQRRIDKVIRAMPRSERARQAWEKPGMQFLASPDWWIESIPEAGMSMAATIGATLAGGPMAGAATAGGVGFSRASRNAEQRIEELHPEWSKEQKQRAAWGVGATVGGVEALTATVPIGIAVRKNPALKSTLSKYVARQMARRPSVAKAVTKLRPGKMSPAVVGSKRIAEAGTTEAAQEFGVEVADMAGTYILLDDPEAFEGGWKRLTAASALGFGLGSAAAGPMAVADYAEGRTRHKLLASAQAAREATTQFERAKTDLETGRALTKLAASEDPTPGDLRKAGIHADLDKGQRAEFAAWLRESGLGLPHTEIEVQRPEARAAEIVAPDIGPEATVDVEAAATRLAAAADWTDTQVAEVRQARDDMLTKERIQGELVRQSDALAQTSEGLRRLERLGRKKRPRPEDFKKAGFDLTGLPATKNDLRRFRNDNLPRNAAEAAESRRMRAMAEQAAVILDRPRGPERLFELSQNPAPSRKDFKRAGFDFTNVRLNDKQRRVFAASLEAMTGNKPDELPIPQAPSVIAGLEAGPTSIEAALPPTAAQMPAFFGTPAAEAMQAGRSDQALGHLAGLSREAAVAVAGQPGPTPVTDSDRIRLHEWAKQHPGEPWSDRAKKKLDRAVKKYVKEGVVPEDGLREPLEHLSQEMRDQALAAERQGVKVDPDTRDQLLIPHERGVSAYDPRSAEERQAAIRNDPNLMLAPKPAWTAGQVPKSRRQIVRDLLASADIAMPADADVAPFLRRSAGFYRWINAQGKAGRELWLSKRHLADVGAAVHEITHFLDDKYNLTGESERVSGVRRGAARLPRIAEADDTGRLADMVERIAEYDYDSEEARLPEGLAELTRLYVTHSDPETVIEPDLLDFYKSAVLSQPEISDLIHQVRQDLLAYDSQSSFDALNHAIHQPGAEIITPNESWFAQQDRQKSFGFIRGAIPRLLNWLAFDRNMNLVRAERQIMQWHREFWESLPPESRRGETFDDAWEEVLRKSGGLTSTVLMHAQKEADATAEQSLYNGVTHPDTMAKFGNAKSPQEIFKDFTPDDLDIFSKFMFSLVGLQRYENARQRGKEYIPSEVDIADMQAAVDSVDNSDLRDRFRTAAAELTDYFADLVRLQEEVGLIAPAEATRILQSHEFYMPFYRMMERRAKGRSRRQLGQAAPSSVKGLKSGSVAPVASLYDAVLDKTLETYKALAYHRALQSFIRIGTESGLGSPFVTTLTPDQLADTFTKQELLARRVRRGELTPDAAQELVDDPDITVESLLNAAAPGLLDNDRAFITSRGPGGRIRIHKIAPEVFNVIRQNFQPGIGETFAYFLSIVGMPVRMGRYALVSINPYFSLGATLRDTQEGYIRGSQDLRKDEPSGGLIYAPRQFGRMAKQAVADVTGQRLIQARESDMDKLFNAMGGRMATRLASANSKFQRGLLYRARRSRAKAEVFGAPRGRPQKAYEQIGLIGKVIERYNELFELPPRKAQFHKTLKHIGERTGEFTLHDDGRIEGTVPRYAKERAFYNAMEASTNFLRRGAAMDYVEPFFLFANATAEGQVSQWLTVKNAAQKVRDGDPRPLMRIMSYIAMRWATKAVWMYGLYHWWKDDEDNPLSDRYLEIPQEYRETNDIFPVNLPGGPTLELWLRKPHEWAFVDQPFDMAMRAIADPGSYENAGDFFQELGAGLRADLFARMPITGGPLSTSIQTYFGYDMFRDRPIENRGDESKLTHLRYDEDWTSWPAKMISRYAGRYVGMSPKEIDFVARNTFGSAPFRMIDFFESRRVGSIPFLGAIIKDPHFRQSTNDLYIDSTRNVQKLNAHEAGHAEYTNDEIENMREKEVRFGQAQRLIRAIREAEDAEELERDEAARLQTGVARWALGRVEMATFQNPLTNQEGVPRRVRDEVRKVLKYLTKMPQRRNMETEEGRQTWRERLEARRKVLRNVGEMRRARLGGKK